LPEDLTMKKILLFSFAVVAHAQTTLLFEHVTLIDGTGRPAKADSCILTAAGKIVRVSACPIPAPPSARTIDGRGKFLIPGMMDVHIHLVGGRGPAQTNNATRPGGDQTAIRALHSYLYSGFTTVLDLGNIPDFIFRMRDLERSGKIVAPRILAAGGAHVP
jgi:imidazolonepropionase-like amidohydrolase